MEASVTLARAKVRSNRSALEGVVRIACPPSAISYRTGLTETVSTAHPGLGVELLSGRAAVDLAKGDADIAIRAVRAADIDVVVAHGFEMGLAVYGARSYLEAKGRPATGAEIAGHRLLRYAGAFLHLSAFAGIEQFADPDAAALRVDSIDSMQRQISAGSGLGVQFCVDGDADPSLVRVLDDPFGGFEMNIVDHQSMRGSARVRAVLDLLIRFHVENRTRPGGRREHGPGAAGPGGRGGSPGTPARSGARESRREYPCP